MPSPHEPADLVPIEIDLAAEGAISYTPPTGCTVDFTTPTAYTSSMGVITQSDVDTHIAVAYTPPSGVTMTISSPLDIDPTQWSSNPKIFIKATSTTGLGYFDDANF